MDATATGRTRNVIGCAPQGDVSGLGRCGRAVQRGSRMLLIRVGCKWMELCVATLDAYLKTCTRRLGDLLLGLVLGVGSATFASFSSWVGHDEMCGLRSRVLVDDREGRGKGVLRMS